MRNKFISLALWALNVAAGALGTGFEKPQVIFPIRLTWEKGAPDGFERDMILMNGQFPGPLLSIDEGDDVEVRSGHTREFLKADGFSSLSSTTFLSQQLFIFTGLSKVFCPELRNFNTDV